MAKKSFYAQKTDGEVMQWEDPKAIEDFRKDAKSGRWRFDAVLERKPKSHAQCKLIFGHMIDQAVRQAAEQFIGVEELMVYMLAKDMPKGQAITKDYLHQLMYIIAPTVDEKGERVTLSKMDSKQASELFTRFINIMAGMGIVIDEPAELKA